MCRGPGEGIRENHGAGGIFGVPPAAIDAVGIGREPGNAWRAIEGDGESERILLIGAT